MQLFHQGKRKEEMLLVTPWRDCKSINSFSLKTIFLYVFKKTTTPSRNQ